MEFYRNQTKHDQIVNKLNNFITTEYAIYPNFGIAEFFEFILTNPYNEGRTVTIIIEDPEISVITNIREWRHFKLLHNLNTNIEENMFHREIRDPEQNAAKYPQVFLRPKETINIPFKFQTFRAESRSMMGHDELSKMRNDDSVIRNLPSNFELKKTHVIFRAEDRSPIAILRLVVDQQAHLVNQTFRFNESENSFLKKTVRVPSSARTLANESFLTNVKLDGTAVEPGLSQVFVRSSDPNVICESRPVNIGEPHDIFIKVFKYN